jgi:hypothetical protein
LPQLKQIELILIDRKKKSAVGTNLTANCNRTNPVLINQINEDEQDGMNAIRKNTYEGQRYNPITKQTEVDQNNALNCKKTWSHTGKML